MRGRECLNYEFVVRLLDDIVAGQKDWDFLVGRA